jgi:hypothetical protein
VQFLITAPNGTAWDAVYEIWFKVTVSATQQASFTTYIIDELASPASFAPANYQAEAPGNVIAALDLTGSRGVASNGLVKAAKMTVAGPLDAKV